METINDLYEEQIKDLYSAEKQLAKALPKMAKKASSPTLKKGFENHLEQTNEHISRLEQIAEMWSFKPTGKKCKAMEGLIEEGSEVIKEKGNKVIIDAALIAAAQRVEHYEISAYGSAKALAEKLGCSDSMDLLQSTLDEESATDELLTKISLGEIMKNAPVEESDDDDEENNSDDEEEEN